MSNKAKYWICQIIKWVAVAFICFSVLVLIGVAEFVSLKTVLLADVLAVLVIALSAAIIYICDAWSKYYKK